MNHTKGEWQEHDGMIYSQEGKTIAMLNESNTMDADAQIICEAVNNYHALKERTERLEHALKCFIEGINICANSDEVQEDRREAYKTLRDSLTYQTAVKALSK